MIKMNNLKQSVILIDKFQGSPKPLPFFFYVADVFMLLLLLLLLGILQGRTRFGRKPNKPRVSLPFLFVL